MVEHSECSTTSTRYFHIKLTVETGITSRKGKHLGLDFILLAVSLCAIAGSFVIAALAPEPAKQDDPYEDESWRSIK
jgi:hypothetical protein